MVRGLLRFSVVTTLLFILPACGSSTKFIDTWRNPDIDAPLHFEKIVMVAITQDQSVRRTAEDQMVRNVARTEAIPSFQVLPGDQAKDVEYAKRVLVEEGFDGAVTMRLVGVNEETTYVPGQYVSAPYYGHPYYGYPGGFYGYYGYSYGVVYEPGYTVTNQVVVIETNIYDLRSGELLWTGRSESIDPSSVRSLIDEIAVALGNTLREQGLIED
jgi:hypothetical protein